METKNKKEEPFNVIFSSGWDFGASGCRPGTLQLVRQDAETYKAAFHVVAGRIVSQRGVTESAKLIQGEMKKEVSKLKVELAELKEAIQLLNRKLTNTKSKKSQKSLNEKIKAKLEILEGMKKEINGMKVKSLTEIMKPKIEELAQEINAALPVFHTPSGSVMKHYMVTSSSAPYDGAIGYSVVQRLVELRDDIIHVNSTNPNGTTFRIKLKNTNKTLGVVVPNKSPWRSKFYSTAPDRYLQDEMARTSQKLCDVYAYGCGSSSLNRRDGEIPFQRITIPSLNKLIDPLTMENMIGVRILQFIPGQHNNPVLTISYKDLLSKERYFITPPANCSKTELRIIEEIKNEGSLSIGTLEHNLEIPRLQLQKALDNLVNRKSKSGLFYNEGSRGYDFDKSYFQKLNYSRPKASLQKDVIASFGCMHTGSIHTDYKFMLHEFPKLIAASEAKYLNALGDQIEGLKHNLVNRGEVLAGFSSYTEQEKLCAFVLAEMILTTLDLRLKKEIPARGIDVLKISPKDVEILIDDLLLIFMYWIGNHDDWETEFGFTPLVKFDDDLRKHLFQNLNKVLAENRLTALSYEAVDKLLESRIRRMKKGEFITLPSGVTVDGAHYYTRRSNTSSSWLQTVLSDLSKAQLLYIANFHVAEMVEEWSRDHGLRVAIQLPTIKTKSEFESNMGKRTDFGAAIQTVWSHKTSDKKTRTVMSETVSVGINSHTSLDNKMAIKLYLDFIGAGKWMSVDKYTGK